MKINKPVRKDTRLSLKITDGLMQKIKSVADKNNVSVNYLVNELLNKALS